MKPAAEPDILETRDLSAPAGRGVFEPRKLLAAGIILNCFGAVVVLFPFGLVLLPLTLYAWRKEFPDDFDWSARRPSSKGARR